MLSKLVTVELARVAFGIITILLSNVRTRVARQPISSTCPKVVPSISIKSPTRRDESDSMKEEAIRLESNG